SLVPFSLQTGFEDFADGGRVVDDDNQGLFRHSIHTKKDLTFLYGQLQRGIVTVVELSIETAVPLSVGKLASGIVGTQKIARPAGGGECLDICLLTTLYRQPPYAFSSAACTCWASNASCTSVICRLLPPGANA